MEKKQKDSKSNVRWEDWGDILVNQLAKSSKAFDLREYHYVAYKVGHRDIKREVVWDPDRMIVIEGSVQDFICRIVGLGNEVVVISSYPLSREQYDNYIDSIQQIQSSK